MASPSPVHQKFLGDTAANHAGATNPVAFHDRDPGAMTGCPFRRCKATRAGSKNNKIKIGVHSGATTAFIVTILTVHGERLDMGQRLQDCSAPMKKLGECQAFERGARAPVLHAPFIGNR